jgi:putative hydrolase of the HAD superfamily
MRAILFDLDDTLLDDRGATTGALDAFLTTHGFERAGREAQHASWRSISARHWLRYESGEVTFLEQRRCRVREFLGRALSDDQADQAFSCYASAYESSWKLLPGVPELLVKTRNIPKVIVTNGEREQQLRKVSATGLADHIVGVVAPADCGYWKPHPKIFLAATDLVGARVSECAMVGDDEIRDLVPSRQLGMRCFHVSQVNALLELIGASRGPTSLLP